MLGMVGLCAVAVVLRTVTFRGLWIDEAIEVSQAKLPFLAMIARVTQSDVHPPLHHSLVWVSIRLFGTSEQAVRLPSVIAGVALVPALFWVGRVCYDRRTGWVAAILATVAPYVIWYSQEARMYTLFMLLSACAVGAQVQAIRRGLLRDWLLYAVFTCLLLATQYFAVLPIAVQQVAFVAVIWRDRADRGLLRSRVRGWLLSCAIIGLAVLPLVGNLPVLLNAFHYLSVPSAAGASNSAVENSFNIYAIGANLTWAMFGYHSDSAMVLLVALWPFAMLLAFMLLGRGRSGPSTLLLILVVAPVIALIIFGSTHRNLFELRYFCGAVPALLLLVARVITACAVRRVGVVAATAVMVVLMGVGLLDQTQNGTNPRRYDFDGALLQIAQRAQPDDIVLFTPSYLSAVVQYYVPDLTSVSLERPMAAEHGVFVVATDLVFRDPQLNADYEEQLTKLEKGRVVVDTFSMPNIHVVQLEPK